ncbi:minichromosome maintenance protein 5 [Blastocladiella emersonii ATCC 22665]|nr:minichromosome maintenance protein 5 [Blastocladiella emersonii ATCC 22665]
MAAAFGWDTGAIFSTASGPGGDTADGAREESFLAFQDKFFDFIQSFNIQNTFIYREQLHQNLMMRKHFLEVHLDHLYALYPDVADRLKKSPAEMLPLFETAAARSAKKILFANTAVDDAKVPAIQVTLLSSDSITPIRDLSANIVGRLVRVTGIVIGASTLSAKATTVHLMCKSCRYVKVLPVTSGFSGIQLPRVCDGPANPGVPKDCPVDPFTIVHDKCSFVDQQSIKLQEAPDIVPVGELPRHIVLSADRALVNRVMPGTRVTLTGIYAVVQHRDGKARERARGAVALRTAYIRTVGLEVHQDQSNRAAAVFSPEEEEEFAAIARRPDLYNEFAGSIAPSIFGHADVKKAVACLLFGGSRKRLADGMRLRGDINVLLLGDPGVAKSQLLKFVERVAPIAVYTSGKGSSAAGLTASVIRDPGSREFYLEGGAMVLADGGVVCIDEFDKMRDEDRVAIHEAMEQQTISIAKAGITTMLNSRTSVLAAANPVFGRYDDLKTAGENIDFQSTILSRFDMIFILKDAHDEASDQRIARHVMGIHKNQNQQQNGSGAQGGDDGSRVDFDMTTMRRYILYARSRCAPRLSEEAAEKLSSYFVRIRSEVRDLEQKTGSRAAVPITVRQLEAVVRISESLAKIALSPTVREDHVDEAVRLFQLSTMHAVESGHVVDDMAVDSLRAEIRQVEDEVIHRLPIGSQTSVASLVAEYTSRGLAEAAVNRAVRILVDRGTLQFRHQRKVVFRSGA